MRKNRLKKIIAIATTVTFLSPQTSNAVYSVAPKYGQCFMHTRADVSASSPMKNPISCSKMHNSETFYVGNWPSRTAPWNMSDKDALDLAVSVCMSDDALTYLPSYFNWWAWFTPSKSSWAQGARWLRCDGMSVSNISTAKRTADYKFRSWSGGKL